MQKKTNPSYFLTDVCRKAGAEVRLAWEIPGPKDTLIEWLSGYWIGKSFCIVQTFKDGNGWEAYTPAGTNDPMETIADVLNRCGVAPPS